MASLRLFVAVDTPPAFKQQAVALQRELRTAGADVSWEKEEKLHCTLKFLGSTPQEKVDRVVAAVRNAATSIPSFPVNYTGTGCFPNKRAPRILWIGMEDPEGVLGRFAADLDNALAPLGFKKEERPFHAHITIGRVKSMKNIRNLLEILEIRTFDTLAAIVQEVAVIRSELKPGGSVYTVLQSISLIGNRGRFQ